ncbi:MAG TPA: hypothetical protein VEC16_04095 [Alphaproteobacteria bacterium]|nr:hypothetical protein [Alphaproteobacteria bacterium]
MVSTNTSTTTAEKVLRIGIFGMFLGHGIFAFGVKDTWIKYLTSVGFSEASAITIMPIIGVMDIIIAFCVLLAPIRIVLLAATIWTFSTALVRPISGEPWLDFVERWANWAAPLALLLLQGIPSRFREWFTIRSYYANEDVKWGRTHNAPSSNISSNIDTITTDSINSRKPKYNSKYHSKSSRRSKAI